MKAFEPTGDSKNQTKTVKRRYDELPRLGERISTIKPESIPIIESITDNKLPDIITISEFVAREATHTVFPLKRLVHTETSEAGIDQVVTKAEEVPLQWNPHIYVYKTTEEDDKNLTAQLDAFFDRFPEYTLAQPTLSDILGLATKAMWHFTIKHNDAANYYRLKDSINLDNPPETNCKVFNGSFIYVYEEICSRFGRTDLLAKYRLAMTRAEFSTDLGPDSDYKFNYGNIEHSDIVIAAYNGSRYELSVIDPYFSGPRDFGRVASPEVLFRRLDKTMERGLNALNGFYRALGGKRDVQLLRYDYLQALAETVLANPSKVFPRDLLEYLVGIIDSGQNEIRKEMGLLSMEEHTKYMYEKYKK